MNEVEGGGGAPLGDLLPSIHLWPHATRKLPNLVGLLPAERTFEANIDADRIYIDGPMYGVDFQDTTLRTLNLELWGGNCGYTAAGVDYPGAWIGPATVALTPLQCNAVLGTVKVAFGATSGTPSGKFLVPAVDLGSIKILNANAGNESPRANSVGIMNYLEVGATTLHCTALGTSPGMQAAPPPRRRRQLGPQQSVHRALLKCGRQGPSRHAVSGLLYTLRSARWAPTCSTRCACAGYRDH